MHWLTPPICFNLLQDCKWCLRDHIWSLPHFTSLFELRSCKSESCFKVRENCKIFDSSSCALHLWAMAANEAGVYKGARVLTWISSIGRHSFRKRDTEIVSQSVVTPCSCCSVLYSRHKLVRWHTSCHFIQSCFSSIFEVAVSFGWGAVSVSNNSFSSLFANNMSSHTSKWVDRTQSTSQDDILTESNSLVPTIWLSSWRLKWRDISSSLTGTAIHQQS